MTEYLDALVSHKPSELPLASSLKFTEDGVEMKIGQGLWKNASRLRSYRLDLLDVRQGVTGAHVVVEETGSPALMALRLKTVDKKITEVETMVVRNQQEGIIFDVDALQTASQAMTRVPERSLVNSREEAIRIASLYPAGLKAGSFLSVDVPFAADAYRFENGRLMAGPGCTILPGCENIKTQRIPTLAGITYRVAAVDEELGIVWLMQNFGPGSIPGGRAGNANAVLNVWELFKVYGGQIHAVEAFMEAMPAEMKSIWD